MMHSIHVQESKFYWPLSCLINNNSKEPSMHTIFTNCSQLLLYACMNTITHTHTHTDTKSNLLNSHQLNISVNINFKIRKGSTGSACNFPFIVAVMQSFFLLDALVQVA